ncbi:MAG: 4Fe-4S binding protein [Proteobacteria bacterium]|nr:4Fe-4S binding protein [Pseudomonadota bacterium]
MKITIPRLSQIVFFIIFLVLFINTDYRGKDEINIAINSFFRADPLVLVTYILSTFSFITLLIPALLMVIATFFLGRFFCGWICPLGAFLDFVSLKIKKNSQLKIFKGKFKYYFLFTLLFLSLFNINYGGVFDPIAIFIRFLTFFVYPLFGYVVKSGWGWLYGIFGNKIEFAEGFYKIIKYNILPFRDTFYPLAFLSSFLFILIVFLERYEKRYWCRHLCPLGTLLGIFSKFSIFKRLPKKLCSDCGECKNICPTAFDREILNEENCIICLDCQVKCKFGRVKFSPFKFNIKSANPDLNKRFFINSFIFGFVLSNIFKNGNYNNKLLRPPGVADEKEFLKKCVRCGECMKICLKNALYPSYLEGGVYSLYTPILIPRKGYCEYNCSLCGQVCPTKAIPKLPIEEKKKQVIGIAHFDKNHCLPYAKKTNCLVCEEHCPIPGKAIKIKKRREIGYNDKAFELLEPYVDEKLCNGCGICEYVCPLTGKSGIEVFREKHSF